MTFSIVARDARTGSIGVATATAGVAVGALVPYAQAGVGAVATQAMTNPYLGIDGVTHLATMSAEDALAAALDTDPEPQRRQVVMLDRQGNTAGWTGSACQSYAGHLLGQDVAVAGNILTGEAVLDAMMNAFAAAPDLPLGVRLLHALTAGAAVGGDARGVGSAALKVVEREAYPSIDIRIDRSDRTMRDLAELFEATTKGGYEEFFSQVVRREGQ